MSERKFLAWFVLGPSGAGKSTYITRKVKKHNEEKDNENNQITYLSADILIRDKGINYQTAREVMEKTISLFVEKGIPFVTEGTGQHDDTYPLFEKYSKDPRIDLKITYIDIDLKTAIARNKSRKRVCRIKR